MFVKINIKICLVVWILALSPSLFAQNLLNKFYKNHIQQSSHQLPVQLNVSISPFFFLEKGGFGFGSGVEFSRFQIGLNYAGYKTMPSAFRDVLFQNPTRLSIANSNAVELVGNMYLRKDRKGFYIGVITNYFRANVTEDATKIMEASSSINFDLLAGFRWFPFKEYFYIDAAYGFSKLVTSSTSKSNIYAYESGFKWFPFVNMGVRFNLSGKARIEDSK
jgi:hypothetical protein